MPLLDTTQKNVFKKNFPLHFTSLFFLFSSAPATHPLNFIVGSRVCTWQMWSVFLVPSRPHGTWNKDSLCLVDGINKKREFDEFSTCSTHALDWHKIILFFGGIFGVDIYIYIWNVIVRVRRKTPKGKVPRPTWTLLQSYADQTLQDCIEKRKYDKAE